MCLVATRKSKGVGGMNEMEGGNKRCGTHDAPKLKRKQASERNTKGFLALIAWLGLLLFFLLCTVMQRKGTEERPKTPPSSLHLGHVLCCVSGLTSHPTSYLSILECSVCSLGRHKLACFPPFLFLLSKKAPFSATPLWV